jgi:SAM-dependent methyltransferase
VFDLEVPIESILSTVSSVGELGSVLLANVLEHTFDPIRALDRACGIMRPGGTCIIITPAVWPLHEFPMDCWRLMPSFYMEYARRRNQNLLQDTFRYVGCGLVSSFVDDTGA